MKYFSIVDLKIVSAKLASNLNFDPKLNYLMIIVDYQHINLLSGSVDLIFGQSFTITRRAAKKIIPLSLKTNLLLKFIDFYLKVQHHKHTNSRCNV